MTKIIKYQLIVLFLGVLILPFLNDGIGFAKFNRKKENRSFKDSLTINFSRLDNFPGDAEAYINDNFSFRNPLLKSFSKLKYYGFGVSPKPEHTIIGNDGWLFFEKFEISCYTGRENFSNQELESMVQIWEKRVQFFNDREIKSYWIIAPIKHSVYDDKLPSKYVKSIKTSRVKQLKTAINKKIPNFVFDPSSELRKASSHDKVFYKMDNHWNFKAGRIATEKLLKHISKDFPHFKSKLNVAWKDTILKKGIHFDVMGLEELSEVDFVPEIKNGHAKEVEKFGFESPKDFAYSWDFERHFKNSEAGNDMKVLIIRDSFGEQMMPFLAESFGETLFIFDNWKYGLNEYIVDYYKPDIVIYVTLETLTNNLLE